VELIGNKVGEYIVNVIILNCVIMNPVTTNYQFTFPVSDNFIEKIP